MKFENWDGSLPLRIGDLILSEAESHGTTSWAHVAMELQRIGAELEFVEREKDSGKDVHRVIRRRKS